MYLATDEASLEAVWKDMKTPPLIDISTINNNSAIIISIVRRNKKSTKLKKILQKIKQTV